MDPNDKPINQQFQRVLAHGEIAFGDTTLPAKAERNTVLKAFADRLSGRAREWKAGGHVWKRDEVLTGILWYPEQLVLLTFDNGLLSLIEFSDSGESAPKWDYSLEIKKYFQVKSEAIKHLGEEYRSNELNDKNMEAIWDFANLNFYVACDARTGGCGIGLRIKAND